MINMSIFNFSLSRRQSQLKGFLLLEISITIVMVMMISLYLFKWYNMVINNHTLFIKKSNALMMASNVIEKIRSDKKINKLTYNEGDFDINVKLEKVKQLNNFYWLKVTVGFNNNLEHIIFKTGLIL